MGDTLYDTDAVLWADAQAALLRRLSRGERVNEEIDWENVIEEVQDVGLSAIRAVRSLLAQAIGHLYKIHTWPDGPVEHWSNEIAAFLSDASDGWTPSMRQRIDIEEVYRKAGRQVARVTFNGRPPGPLPERCPFTIDDLVIPGDVPEVPHLLAKLRAEAVA